LQKVNKNKRMLSEFIKSTIAPIGAKLTGAISSIGHKISTAGRGITGFIDKIPIIGEVARPFTKIGNSVLDIVDGVTNVSDSLNRALTSTNQEAAAAMLGNAAKGGRDVINKAGSLLRRRT